MSRTSRWPDCASSSFFCASPSTSSFPFRFFQTPPIMTASMLARLVCITTVATGSWTGTEIEIVGIDDDDIGEFARRQRADLARAAEHRAPRS